VDSDRRIPQPDFDFGLKLQRMAENLLQENSTFSPEDVLSIMRSVKGRMFNAEQAIQYGLATEILK